MFPRRLGLHSLSSHLRHIHKFTGINRYELLVSHRFKSQLPQDENTDDPIQYSSSEAAKWTTQKTYGIGLNKNPPPAAQAWAVSLSIAIFLVYFCILREENDIDELMWKTPYDSPAANK